MYIPRAILVTLLVLMAVRSAKGQSCTLRSNTACVGNVTQEDGNVNQDDDPCVCECAAQANTVRFQESSLKFPPKDRSENPLISTVNVLSIRHFLNSIQCAQFTQGCHTPLTQPATLTFVPPLPNNAHIPLNTVITPRLFTNASNRALDVNLAETFTPCFIPPLPEGFDVQFRAREYGGTWAVEGKPTEGTDGVVREFVGVAFGRDGEMKVIKFGFEVE
ncbi:hypothetical protein HK104_011055 [Borealophlyctis nickersoniae]|nr:hypothetical protein HK104_011055 [Borealophlyctis nickersoniae]